MTTTKQPTPDVTILRGLPFISDTFAVSRLLAAVVAVRQVHAREQELDELAARDDFMAWLAPDIAVRTRHNASVVPSRPLTKEHQEQIATVLRELAELMPAWSPLLALPVRYVLLDPSSPAYSASSFWWPQHILLADSVFASNPELREQVVHELGHQWLYLIEEIWSLASPDAPCVVLPSGTADRSPREVIGAAHVVAALARMHRTERGPGYEHRIEKLTDYGHGCLALLAELDAELTDTGRTLTHQLTEAL